MKIKQFFTILAIVGSFTVLATFGFAQDITKNQSKKSELNKDLENLVNTEKTFAAAGFKEGFRDSFIKFFAEDGIGFSPKPGRTKEALLKTPSVTEPSPVVFNWQPMFGDISIAGDLGYTTGPILYTDRVPGTRPPRHGLYFSVWQKQPDKTWKVAIDMGVGVPQAVAPFEVDFTKAKNPNGIAKSKIKKSDEGNFNTLDADFTADIEKSNLPAAYNNWLSDEFRIHRPATMPILDKESLNKYFASRSITMSFQQIGGKIAQSKDLAFTYGSFQATVVKDGKESKPTGYYVHVWRRNQSGKWKLVADIIN